MTGTIRERTGRLRELMKLNGVDACIVTGADPHLSEYPPDNRRTREWISGFTGSYGKVLITKDEFYLWTDTRYFLQAEIELEGTGCSLMKERIPGAVSMEDWICMHVSPGMKVSVDGWSISASEAEGMKAKLAAKGITLVFDLDLVGEIWKNRPAGKESKIFEHPVNFAGKSRLEKLEIVRKTITAAGNDALVVTMPDEIAWLFNLRSREQDYNPVFPAYAVVNQAETHLFVDPAKLTREMSIMLRDEGIKLHSYGAFFEFIQRMAGIGISIDPLRTSMAVFECLKSNNVLDKTTASVVTRLKSVKDSAETRNLLNAMARDGAALVNAICWITRNIDLNALNECSLGKVLDEFRSMQDHYMGESFHPIVGFGPNGAIVHYHATTGSAQQISRDNLLLIDSGGQYLDGTTDITRTLCLGIATPAQKSDYTTVLKSHIALATAIFPYGTKGYSLDAITRKALWDRCLNYGHGTGHGIGYFLSVHEGPMSIRTEYNDELILEGQVLSNEPGLYREGEYGIRIENVILCRPYEETNFGRFLCFETISLCPLEPKLIDATMLNNDEIGWVNNYHTQVLEKISPLLTDNEVLTWLKKQCEPIRHDG